MHARIALMVFVWAVACQPVLIAGQGLSDAWSRQEASEKIGVRVEYIAPPGHELLQWGPRFTGWSPEKQPKATGKSVEKGTRGTIMGIIKASQDGYFLIIHWDALKGKQTFWTTVITRVDYPSLIELVSQEKRVKTIN